MVAITYRYPFKPKLYDKWNIYLLSPSAVLTTINVIQWRERQLRIETLCKGPHLVFFIRL